MPVVGDPDGMRALAKTLRSRADRLKSIGDRLDDKSDDMKFEGPYATTVRGRIEGFRARGDGVAGDLDDAASELMSAAARVEFEKAAEARAIAARQLAAEQAAEAARRR